MKKIISLFLIAGCLGVITYLLFVNCSDESVHVKDLSLEDNLYLDRIESEKYNFRKIEGKETVVNSKNDSLLLIDVISKLEKPILVVRFSSFGCSSCVDYLLLKTKPLAKEMNCGTKLMLTANLPVDDLHVIQSNYNDFIIYKSDSVFTDFDMALTPYLFFINENNVIQDFYIPRKEVPDSVDAFFKYLDNKYVKS